MKLTWLFVLFTHVQLFSATTLFARTVEIKMPSGAKNLNECSSVSGRTSLFFLKNMILRKTGIPTYGQQLKYHGVYLDQLLMLEDINNSSADEILSLDLELSSDYLISQAQIFSAYTKSLERAHREEPFRLNKALLGISIAELNSARKAQASSLAKQLLWQLAELFYHDMQTFKNTAEDTSWESAYLYTYKNRTSALFFEYLERFRSCYQEVIPQNIAENDTLAIGLSLENLGERQAALVLYQIILSAYHADDRHNSPESREKINFLSSKIKQLRKYEVPTII